MGSIVKSMIEAVTKRKDVLAGIATVSGLALAKNVLSKPGINAYLEYHIEKIVSGWTELEQLPEEVIRTADAIAGLFKARLISPNRIAIDGVPGSGKSSLAVSLADRLDMEVECLDHRNLDKEILFDKNRTIYEHHRLLRTQNIDNFDVIIYIDEPVEISKKKVLQRKRGGYLVDIMDYGKLKVMGEKAFSVAEGETIQIGSSFAKVKIRPEDGYRDVENISKELRQKGVNRTVLNKEEALFLCVEGRAKKGFTAYLNKRAYHRELLSALTTGLSQFTKTKNER